MKLNLSFRHIKNEKITPQIKSKITHLDKLFFPGCVPVKFKNTDLILCFDNDNNKKIIAYGAVQFEYIEKYSLFTRSGVLPLYRGNKIQDALLKRIIKVSKDKKMNKIISYTSHDNNASMNTLIRNKFKTYTPQYRYAGINFVYWVKELN